MHTSDTLFRLIKSLSKNEKGYFKKYYSGGAKSSNYLDLFDAIDKQDTYDEEALVKKFRKETFVKQLSVTKHYLYNQVLKSLRSYNTQNMANALINDAIENSEVLFTRALYPQSFDELAEALEKSVHYDQPLKQLEIKARERALHLEIAAKNWNEQIGQNIEDTKQILEDYTVYLELFGIYYKLMFFWRHERTIRTEQQAEEFKQLMEHPLVNGEPHVTSFYMRQLFYTIHMIYNFITNNDEKSFDNMQRILRMWDDTPHMKTIEPVKYISAVNNYFNNCYKIQRFDLIRDYLATFDATFAERNDAVQAILFENFSSFKMVLLYAENKFDDIINLLNETKEGIKQFAGQINPVRILLLRFNSMILYWIQGDLSSAIDSANEILDEKNVDLRRDVQAATRIIYLILHYEIDNAVMLEHAVRSSKRYLQTRDKYYETERVFFKHFLQLNHSSDKHERMEVYKALHKELTHLITELPLEKNFLQTFNIFNWLDAKIEGITLKEFISKNPGQ